FLGPNGAGKTTAIRCILGLIRRDAGQVQIFGETDLVRQRAHVGAMVETPAFHTWLSARDNLRRACAYAGQGDDHDISLALERAGLQGRADERVAAYSLGMRQRLGIARALVGRPKLLILDEPTNGLDPRGMREIRDLLLDLARRDRLTIFLSSHLLGEVEQLCGRVGILDRGHMVVEGTVDELLRKSGAAVTEIDLESDDTVALGRSLDGIAGVTVVGDGEGDRLRVRLDGLTPAELNQRLVQAGVPIAALVPVVKSLEDLFLTLTSQELT
ncbi:MAG: ABC transporter ATP-binding protein, partial [Oligoflexia bacterium]|nr:ABC transporter ATP-binding protein [Oligoflexia bacterium]